MAASTTAGNARLVLHQVATHVLARRRFEVTGRFGLRASPGGLATPAFGPEPERLRTSGGILVREVGATTRVMPMKSATLRQLASFAGTDVDQPFSAGDDTPALGDPDSPLQFDPEDMTDLGAWFCLAWEALDEAVGMLAVGSEVATIQLWPEHFDASSTIAVAEEKVNLGFSPGDSWLDEPYAYVGPWGQGRPGDPSFWNAPFGAALKGSDLPSGRLREACRTFFVEGVNQLTRR